MGQKGKMVIKDYNQAVLQKKTQIQKYLDIKDQRE